MWSDEINKKMEEAGESNNPAYNEKAWENMQSLLDKHLPVEKKRRRIIFFLLPLALAGGIAFFISQRKTTKNVPITNQKNTVLQQPSTTDKVTTNPGNLNTTASGKITEPTIDATGTNAETNVPGQNQPGSSLPAAKEVDKAKVKTVVPKLDSKSSQSVLKKKNGRQTQLASSDHNPVNEKTTKPVAPSQTDNSLPTANNAITNHIIKPTIIDSAAASNSTVTNDKKLEDTIAATTTAVQPKSQKSKVKAGSKLSLNLSFGPDVSSTGIDNPGKLELQYGLGASYAISKRLTVRTGFFAGRKIYTADPENYKAPYTIHNLEKVDANCMVFEIPLTLMYNFSLEKKHNWFIGGGLSSYFMKRETYGYHYKNPWGQPQFYKRTYKNENTHLFSVINLSGGYQYHFSDRFSIMAEPYIKIPASGIGVGKVKLNSGGVLFTAGFKPFLKKN